MDKPILFHFNCANHGEIENDGEKTSEKYPLVRKGNILVSLSHENCSEEDINYTLESGSNTELEQNCLRALVSGYPVVSSQKSGTVCVITVSVTPLVTISQDKMFASINFYLTPLDSDPIVIETLLDCLKEEGIVYGIDRYKLETSLIALNDSDEPIIDLIAARGILPLNGRDASFRFSIDVGPYPGTLQQGGRIDFRERKIFVGVEQGDTIGFKVPATEGTPGRNLFGDTLNQKPGKDIKVTAAGDVEFFPDSGEIRSKCAGVLSIANNNNIKVTSKQIFSGNIDYATGNVESKGSVEISGSVLPGFSVAARGNIVIGENVDSASITTKANAIVRSGLIGKEGIIKARGDIDIQFIQQSRVEAGGIVLIRKEAYYSIIQAEKAIHCGEKSTILGCTLLSGGDISAGTIGSTGAKPSIIAAGVNVWRYWKKSDLKKKIDELQDHILVLQQRHGSLAHDLKKYKKISNELHTLSETYNNLNLISDTDELSLHEPLMNYSQSKIVISGIVEQGALIQIGNLFCVLEKQHTSVTFKLDERQEKIIHTNT